MQSAILLSSMYLAERSDTSRRVYLRVVLMTALVLHPEAIIQGQNHTTSPLIFDCGIIYHMLAILDQPLVC